MKLHSSLAMRDIATTGVTQIEPRWPVVVTIVAVAGLLTLLPGRIRVFPAWVPPLLALGLIVPMGALRLTTPKTRWLRIEGVVTVVFLVVTFLVVTGFGMVDQLTQLLSSMVRRSSEITGVQLLTSHMPLNWRPTFIDYLFLAFCTATAFSPAEAQPLTARGMLLLMLESIVSLVTILAVAARAINILGS